jgi:hypothetical protein
MVERDNVNAFYSVHKELAGSFDDMRKTLEPYVDYVMEEYEAIRKKDAAAELMTEQHVDFSDIVPGGFGTSDVVIIGDDTCEVIDLKYGKGVPISAIANPQIRLYTYGTMSAFDLSYDFSRVKMVIYQPRLDSVTSEELTADDLRSWGKAVIAPAAKRALSKNPKYNPGTVVQVSFLSGCRILQGPRRENARVRGHDRAPTQGRRRSLRRRYGQGTQHRPRIHGMG